MRATDVPVTATTQGQTATATPSRRGFTVGNRRLLVSRLIAVGLMASAFWGIWWFFTSSSYAEPITSVISPYWNQAVALINDPLGVDWGGILFGVAAIIITHLGMISFLFDIKELR